MRLEWLKTNHLNSDERNNLVTTSVFEGCGKIDINISQESVYEKISNILQTSMMQEKDKIGLFILLHKKSHITGNQIDSFVLEKGISHIA